MKVWSRRSVVFLASTGLVLLAAGMATILEAAAIGAAGLLLVVSGSALVGAAAAAPRHGPTQSALADDRPPSAEGVLGLSTDTPVSRQSRPADAEALLRLSQELNACVHSDRLRIAIAQHLKAILGFEDVWLVTRLGEEQQVILPVLGEPGSAAEILTARPGQWATQPLTVGGETIGVLGVALERGSLSRDERRVLVSAAAIVAQALKTAHTFEVLREASIIDPLTGCCNRSEGIARLTAELRRAQRSGLPVALLLLDLDHFKSINDRLGHNCGDAVLAFIGRTIMNTLRASDVRCRWGGEEFLIVLPENSLEDARSVAESLRLRVAEAKVRYETRVVSLTASIGVTLARPGETDIEALVARVDAALYRAKSEGRNCVRVEVADSRVVPAEILANNGPVAVTGRRTATGPMRTDTLSPDVPQGHATLR